MNDIDMAVAIEVLESLKDEYNIESDEYANISQTQYYLEQRKS